MDLPYAFYFTITWYNMYKIELHLKYIILRGESMTYLTLHEKEDKGIREEYKKCPQSNLNDSLKKSEVGNITEISRNGWKANILIIVALIGIYLYIKLK